MRKGSRVKGQRAESNDNQAQPGAGHNSSDVSLEDGIASIFAAIQQDGFSGETNDNDMEEFDSTPMEIFLGELNRLWADPQAA